MAMQQAGARRRGEAGRNKASYPTAASVRAKLALWLARIRSHAFWVQARSPRSLWGAALFLFEWIYSFITKLPWILAILVIGVIIVQGLTQNSTVINPISVPADLARNGYTPEVAGQRLRDAMTEFTAGVNSYMSGPDIAVHGDLPNIVVPTVGLSLDAIVASVRTLLRSTRSRSVTGEITIKEKQLYLLLRMDGRKFYESEKGVDIEKPDALFEAAAPEVLKIIRPYFVAVAMRHKDPESALVFVNQMIAKMPAGDENIPWFYSQQGLIYLERKDYAAAIQSFQTALRLTHGSLMPAHANLALVYKALDQDDKAFAEYKIALKQAPEFAALRFEYATTLAKAHREQEAIAELRKAIALKPDYTEARQELDKLLPPQASTGTVPQK
jgi:hypothetical protein